MLLAQGLIAGAGSQVLGAQPLAQESAVVVEEAEVVADDQATVVESSSDSGDPHFSALAIAPQLDEADRLYYQRRSTEAFINPDTPLNLEFKYYFALGTASSEPPPLAPPIGRVELGPDAGAESLAGYFPLTELDPVGVAPRGEVHWLDYESKTVPKLVAILLRGGEAGPPRLVVGKVALAEGTATIESVSSDRALEPDELPNQAARPWLACWDRSTAMGPGALLFSRQIVLLTRRGDRYWLDFFSERLRSESDRRVGLTAVASGLGTPGRLAFDSILLRRENGKISPQSILCLTLARGDDSRTIGLDYPVCIPPLLAQMRRAQSRPSGRSRTTTDLTQLVGEEALLEFECRLVNAEQK